MATGWKGPGVIPPPPGETPNFVNPVDQMPTTIAIHTVFLTIATLCMGIRIYTRHFINHSLGIDDYFCFFGYCNAVVFSALLIWGGTLGLGRHLWDVTFPSFVQARRALTTAEYIYFLAAAFIKLSCLLFYRRVFSPSKRIIGFIWGGIICVSIAYLILLFATVFECWPVEASWNPAVQGHCLPPKGLPYASGAVNVVTDIYVLLLPLPTLWKLNMKMSRKLRTMALFCLGIFVCVTSLIRLGMTPVLYKSTDATWVLVQIEVWAVIEIDVGVICACLLAFPAFIEHHKTSRFGSYMSRMLSTRTSGASGSNGTWKPASGTFKPWTTKASRSAGASTDSHSYGDVPEDKRAFAIHANEQSINPKTSFTSTAGHSDNLQTAPTETGPFEATPYGQASRRDVFELQGIAGPGAPHTTRQ